jgi:transposase
MRAKPRVYTEEFKRDAVKLAERLDSIARAAEQLGTSSVNIYEWKKKFGVEVSTKSIPAGDIAAAEREELLRLRKEVSDLKKVNHILKAAAAFFSQDHLK